MESMKIIDLPHILSRALSAIESHSQDKLVSLRNYAQRCSKYQWNGNNHRIKYHFSCLAEIPIELKLKTRQSVRTSSPGEIGAAIEVFP